MNVTIHSYVTGAAKGNRCHSSHVLTLNHSVFSHSLYLLGYLLESLNVHYDISSRTYTFIHLPTDKSTHYAYYKVFFLWTIDNYAAQRHNANKPLQAHHSLFHTNRITSPIPVAMLASSRTHIPVSPVAHSGKGLNQNGVNLM